ncbi:MAG: histidinol-phosphate transaminase [Corynebacterium sp.]|nr:histidinol-phosphate transaminase [Corynebacterium sp.]
MTDLIRPDLAHIPAYVAGKDRPDAIKLSSNEVSFGPLPSVQRAIDAAGRTANRYPDIAAWELREALGRQFGLAGDQVAVGAGSSSLCQQLVQVTCLSRGDEVIFPWRSFEAYPIFVAVVGATPRPIPLVEDTQAVDLEGIAAAVTDRTKLIFVCNPNNPSGTAFDAAAFEQFMARIPVDVLVALDEAYIEFAQVESGVGELEKYPNLVVLRTFSKAYGLAGLRLGYMLGPVEIVEAVNKVSIPFVVSSVAQAAGIASLESQAQVELKERVDAIVAERERVFERLSGAMAPAGGTPTSSASATAAPTSSASATAAPAVVASQANFLWLPGSHLTDLDGVVLRVFDEGTRITIGTPEESEALYRALGI